MSLSHWSKSLPPHKQRMKRRSKAMFASVAITHYNFTEQMVKQCSCFPDLKKKPKDVSLSIFVEIFVFVAEWIKASTIITN